MVAGCGAKPPPEPAPVTSSPHERARPRRVVGFSPAAAPRPDIDVSAYLPDFDAELRWPLSAMAHPSLQPRFPIARELANGVSWQKLCERGVHKRVSATERELLSYLHGWCDVLKRDVDGACMHLVPLLGSVQLGLSAAVRQDLANILVDSGSADAAEHYLSTHDIRDVELLDLLAANFVEIGKPEGALELNRRAMGVDYRAPDEATCRRLTRQIVLANDGEHAPAFEALSALATKPKVPDPLCVRLFHKVACWRTPGIACRLYLADEGLNGQTTSSLLEAYYRWPEKAGAWEWSAIADTASSAMPLPGAAELAVVANEAAAQASPRCTRERSAAIRRTIDRIRRDPERTLYLSRLNKLQAACPPVWLDPTPVNTGPDAVAPWPAKP
jgi:hypothetical protein